MEFFFNEMIEKEFFHFFKKKIQHAVQAGYKAMILYSPMDFYQTSVIYSTTFERNI